MTEAAEHIVRSAFPDVLERLVNEATAPLRAEVERLRNHPYGHMINERDVTIEALRAENERLREKVENLEMAAAAYRLLSQSNQLGEK